MCDLQFHTIFKGNDNEIFMSHTYCIHLSLNVICSTEYGTTSVLSQSKLLHWGAPFRAKLIEGAVILVLSCSVKLDKL